MLAYNWSTSTGVAVRSREITAPLAIFSPPV